MLNDGKLSKCWRIFSQICDKRPKSGYHLFFINEAASVAWALGTLRLRHEGLLADAGRALANAPDLADATLVEFLWGCARVGAGDLVAEWLPRVRFFFF